MRFATSLLVLLTACVLPTGSLAAAYRSTILQPLTGHTRSEAHGVNDAGLVVGESSSSLLTTTACIWENTVVRSLGTLPGGTRSSANSINASGTIVGWSTAADGLTHACTWDSAGIHDLGIIDSYSTKALDINNAGLIVGSAGEQYPCAWQAGEPQLLAKPLGSYGVSAVAVNDAGLIAGQSNWSRGASACVWDADGVRFLPSEKHEVQVYDISKDGVVAGRDYQQACIWDATGQHFLEAPGATQSGARHINDLGQIVGWVFGPVSSTALMSHPCVWENGLPVDISLTPMSYGSAFCNNNLGSIVGYNSQPDGDRGVLWEPVPEPSALLAVLCGMAGCAWRGKRLRGSRRNG